MKEYTTDQIRNVAFVGHQSSGKTALVEALLFNTGAITRMGSISEKNTVSDWEDMEKDRGLSLSTSLVPIEFNDYKVNILDAPGYIDLQGEMRNAIRVSDAVVVVVDAASGVEVGTELAWEYAKTYQQSIIVTINKMDRDSANYERTMNELRETFPEYKFIPVMLPIGSQEDFKGVANLVNMHAYLGKGDERSDLPDDMTDITAEAHLTLVEAAAEADDELIEKYFEEEELSIDEIRDGMRKAARSSDLKTVPVFVTSATENIGTIPLLEALIAYTISPGDRRVFAVNRTKLMEPPQTDDGPLAAYVFKTTNDKYVGTLNYFRVFSGHINADTRYHNTTRDKEERFGSIFVMRGKEQLQVPTLHAGDIGVVAKLNETHTGDTFSTDDFEILRPDFPKPLYSVAVTPRTQADSAKMGPTLSNLVQADPTLRTRTDDDTQQILLEGMGEIHVNVAIKRAEGLGVGIDTTVPKIPYRETITSTAEATYRHKKQSGGAGQFGEVTLRVETLEEGFEYKAEIFGGAISQQFQSSAEKGIRSVLPEGIIAGYPVTNVRAVVFDGKEHPVDSKDIAFQIAGREAFKEAFRKAKPVLLEPIMDVKITVPEPMMGDIMGDLNTRRGRIQGMDGVGNKSIVSAQVPYAEMMRYGNDLRSISGGRGVYTMDFSHYERVPTHLTDEIIAASKAADE